MRAHEDSTADGTDVLLSLQSRLAAAAGLSLVAAVNGHNHPECSVLVRNAEEEPCGAAWWRQAGSFAHDDFDHFFNSSDALDPRWRTRGKADRVVDAGHTKLSVPLVLAHPAAIELSCCPSACPASHEGFVRLHIGAAQPAGHAEVFVLPPLSQRLASGDPLNVGTP